MTNEVTESDQVSGSEASRVVRIHIDQKPYNSPTPTTATALYQLGRVEPGLKLYREIDGEQEELALEEGPDLVPLTEDERFRSGRPRGTTIVVEGTLHEWPARTITYAEVVTLFEPSYPQHPEITYSVTYDHGPGQNREGILSPGGSVRIKERMVFHVSPTGQS